MDDYDFYRNISFTETTDIYCDDDIDEIVARDSKRRIS